MVNKIGLKQRNCHFRLKLTYLSIASDGVDITAYRAAIGIFYAATHISWKGTPRNTKQIYK